MSSLVLELQKEALSSSVPITDLLRKASVVSKKLGILDFYEWCQNELNGYESSNDIPPYREVKGEIKAYNPYNGWIQVIFEDISIKKYLSKRSLRQSISNFVSLLSKSPPFLEISFPPEIEQKYLKDEFDFKTTLHVSSSTIYAIIDKVRNAVLVWALKLEEEGIMGEGMSFTDKEKEKAHKSNNITIQNFQGIFGDVSDSTVTQSLNMNIKQGGFGWIS